MAKKKNPWMIHLEKIRKKHPKKTLSEIMQIAKKSYKK